MKKQYRTILATAILCISGFIANAQSTPAAPFNLEGTYQYAPEGVKLTWRSEAPVFNAPDDLYFDLETMLEDWTTIDADGDTHGWRHVQGLECPSGYICLISESKDCYGVYDGIAYTPDNYIVTPKIRILPDTKLSLMACAADAILYNEHFGVAISTTGNTNAADFTTIAEWSITPSKLNQTPWKEYVVDLSEYQGQEVYVGFRHFNCTNQFAVAIDDIRFSFNAESNNLESFNIYRSDNGNDYQLIANVPAIEFQTEYEYLDAIEEANYHYQVTAVYAGNIESEPATFVLNVTSTTENTVNALVYPNPTSGLLKVSAANLKQITLTNALGQVIVTAKANNNDYFIDLSSYENGLYFIQIETENGLSTQRVTLTR